MWWIIGIAVIILANAAVVWRLKHVVRDLG